MGASFSALALQVRRNPAVADIHFRKDGQFDVNTRFQESVGRLCGNGQLKMVMGLKHFDTDKEVEGLLASMHAEDDKARLSLELAGLHEQHGEYPKAI